MAAFGCTQKNGGSVTATMDCDPYFIFDKVEHYSIKIKEDTIWTLNDKEIMTADESGLLNLLTLDTLDLITDTTQFVDIESFGYKKAIVPAEKHQQISELFCERIYDELSVTMCIAIYRDVLIFKQKHRTIGFAKICFDCDKSVIAGTKKDVNGFGQAGEFRRLEGLLGQ